MKRFLWITLFLASHTLAYGSSEIAEREQEASRLIQAGNVAGAIPLLRQIHNARPYDERARYRLARALLLAPDDRAHLSEAARHFSECVRIHTNVDPESPAVARRHFYHGMALWHLDSRREALAAFERAYRIDASLLEALYNQAAVLEELGQATEAQIRFARIREPGSRG